MKIVLTVLFALCAITVKSQEVDSTYSFTKADILLLANKIQLLRDSIRFNTDIILAQDTLIVSYKQKIAVCDNQVKNRNSTVDALEKENQLLKENIKLLTPKWYDNKMFWFGNGVMATLIIAVLLR